MGKPTICIGENKGAYQLRAFVFATRIVQFLFYLTPKFQAFSLLLELYRPVCVRYVRKPHCWLSHEVAHLLPGFCVSDNVMKAVQRKKKKPLAERIAEKEAARAEAEKKEVLIGIER